MIRFLTIRLLWLLQTPSGSTIVQSCTIETTQTSITWVSHYSHILDLLWNISLIQFPILYLANSKPLTPKLNTRCTEAEKTALQTTTNTLFVAQRIFTAFAVSILNELSGAIGNWNEKPKQSRRNKVMSKNCPESAGATPSTAELEVLVNEITTGTSTKAASSRNRLRLLSF